MFTLPVKRILEPVTERVGSTDERTADEQEPEPQSDGNDQQPPPSFRLLRGLARGVQGGIIATLTMTVFRLPTMRSLPPTANVWSKYVAGGEPEEHPVAGLGLHLLYGAGAGGAFGVCFEAMDAERAMESETRGLLWGTVYGLVLSTFGTHVALKRLLDVRLDEDELTIFHAGHVVYGLSLGAWVGSRVETAVDEIEEAYDYED